MLYVFGLGVCPANSKDSIPNAPKIIESSIQKAIMTEGWSLRRYIEYLQDGR